MQITTIITQGENTLLAGVPSAGHRCDLDAAHGITLTSTVTDP